MTLSEATTIDVAVPLMNHRSGHRTDSLGSRIAPFFHAENNSSREKSIHASCIPHRVRLHHLGAVNAFHTQSYPFPLKRQYDDGGSVRLMAWSPTAMFFQLRRSVFIDAAPVILGAIADNWGRRVLIRLGADALGDSLSGGA